MRKDIIYGCEARGDNKEPYLTRYTLLERANFKICLHIFHRSDADDLHDHPWSFISFILWRGYREQTPKEKRRIYPGMVLYRKAKHLHRVELINEKKAVTLVIMGKRKRHWGFVVKGKWTYWKRYFRDNNC